jgi:hypothetical protein
MREDVAAEKKVGKSNHYRGLWTLQQDASESKWRCFRFRLGVVSRRTCTCFKISERSKSTSTTFLISGFHNTFGGRTSRSTHATSIQIVGIDGYKFPVSTLNKYRGVCAGIRELQTVGSRTPTCSFSNQGRSDLYKHIPRP